MVEEPDSENSLFSEPMKIRTPSACSARPKRSMTSRRVSRSSNNSRTRSRSLSALRASSRCAWPRTISLRSPLSPPGLPRLEGALELVPRLGDGHAADMGVEEVRGLGQCRGGQADRDVEHAVL